MTNKVRQLLKEIRERADHLKDVIPETDRSLPEFTGLGGYSLMYVTDAGVVLCGACATEALDENDDDPPADYDTYAEGPPLFCEGCNKEILSSYGDPDERQDE